MRQNPVPKTRRVYRDTNGHFVSERKYNSLRNLRNVRDKLPEVRVESFQPRKRRWKAEGPLPQDRVRIKPLKPSKAPKPPSKQELVEQARAALQALRRKEDAARSREERLRLRREKAERERTAENRQIAQRMARETVSVARREDITIEEAAEYTGLDEPPRGYSSTDLFEMAHDYMAQELEGIWDFDLYDLDSIDEATQGSGEPAWR